VLHVVPYLGDDLFEIHVLELLRTMLVVRMSMYVDEADVRMASMIALAPD
jgi:hypothetical protein